MRNLNKFLFFLFSAILIQRFCHNQTDGFTISKIQSNLAYHSEWEAKSIEPIGLDQPFYYLGKGAQIFAFVSEDGQYVLKFYRQHRAGHPFKFLAFILPSSLKARLFQTIEKRENKRLKDYTSYKIAHDHLSEETGLIYLHLNQTDHLNKILTLYDKIKIAHKIDLDKMVFFIQKKADPFYPTLEKWILEKNFEKAKQSLSQLIGLLRYRCQKGIFDKDPDLKTNFGFIGETPIQLDIGRFRKDPNCSDPNVYADEIIRITDNLCNWLDEKAPNLSRYVRQEIENN